LIPKPTFTSPSCGPHLHVHGTFINMHIWFFPTSSNQTTKQTLTHTYHTFSSTLSFFFHSKLLTLTMAPSLSKPSLSSITKHVNGFNPSLFTLSNSTLQVKGHVILSQVPQNITLTPCTYDTHTTGCFLGFHAPSPDSRHVAPLGQLKNINFSSIFRFKVWWTTLWSGSNGRDLETETQFLMLQSGPDRPYVLFLPIVEGPFRASLEPGSDDNISVPLNLKK